MRGINTKELCGIALMLAAVLVILVVCVLAFFVSYQPGSGLAFLPIFMLMTGCTLIVFPGKGA